MASIPDLLRIRPDVREIRETGLHPEISKFLLKASGYINELKNLAADLPENFKAKNFAGFMDSLDIDPNTNPLDNPSIIHGQDDGGEKLPTQVISDFTTTCLMLKAHFLNYQGEQNARVQIEFDNLFKNSKNKNISEVVFGSDLENLLKSIKEAILQKK